MTSFPPSYGPLPPRFHAAFLVVLLGSVALICITLWNERPGFAFIGGIACFIGCHWINKRIESYRARERQRYGVQLYTLPPPLK